MYVVKYINCPSAEYKQSLELKDEVIFKPLGTTVYAQNNFEDNSRVLIGAFETNSIYTNLLLGVVSLSFNGDVCRVEEIYVDKILQRKGVGTSLMRVAEKVAGDKGARKLELSAKLDTIDFFQRFGYMQKGEIFRKDSIFGDCVNMVKPIFVLKREDKEGHHHHHHDHNCGCGHNH